MELLTPDLRAALLANTAARWTAGAAQGPEPDPAPIVKLLNPVGTATWLATELDDDGDTLFGLADLGFGCPELGSFSLTELQSVRLKFGLTVERDIHFASVIPLSLWADAARAAGSIIRAQAVLADTDRRLRAALDLFDPDQLPPPERGG